MIGDSDAFVGHRFSQRERERQNAGVRGEWHREPCVSQAAHRRIGLFLHPLTDVVHNEALVGGKHPLLALRH